MGIGAILTSGGCRALKGMALLGAGFALGAVEAAAQFTVTVPDTVDEGGRLTISASATVQIAAGADASAVDLTVTPAATAADAVSAPKTPAEEGDVSGGFVAETLILAVPANAGTSAVTTPVTGELVLQTIADPDSESEAITLTLDLVAHGNVGSDGTTVLALPAGASPRDVTIVDLDVQRFEWTVTTSRPAEGSPIGVTLAAVPAPDELIYPTALSVDRAGYAIDADDGADGNQTTATLTASAAAATITITPPTADGNRDEDTVTLRATVAGATTDRLDPLEIDVADIHALPAGDDITAKAYLDDGNGAKTGDEATSVTEGGDPVHVTVTVDRGANGYPAGEKLEVAVTAADDGQSRDYRVDPASVDIDSGTGEQSMDFKLWASPDDDVGAEELVLSLVATGETAANGPGQSTGTFTIAIADDTTKQVEPVSAEAAQAAVDAALAAAVGDEGLNPGESFTVMATDLFTVTAGYTARYTASATGGAARVSTAGASVTVTADSAGTATVTVTATTTEASSATVSQTVANSADVTFDVVVADRRLMVTVAADPVAIDEGGESTITATANRDVTAGDGEVEVNLSVAGPATLSANAIVIAAGSMTGTATLTAAEDDDYADETVTLIYSGSGIDGQQQIEIAVADNDEAPGDTTYTLTIEPAETVAGRGANVTEGGEPATVTATASRAVEAVTEVTLMRDASSTAGAADYTAAPITIVAGHTSGSTTVTAVDDGMAEEAETLTLYGLVGDVRTNSVKLTIWDAAAPALPVVAGVLLAVLLAVGGYRHRRR